MKNVWQISLREWICFFVFASCVLLKIVLFHVYCFHGLLLSSILTNPVAFFSFWLPKLSAVFAVSALFFFFRDKRWLAILLLIFDVWIEANLIYFRTNKMFIDYYALTMGGNMDGLWESVLIFFSVRDVVFPMISLLFAGWTFMTKQIYCRRLNFGGILMALTVAIQVLGNYCHSLEYKENPFEPIQLTQNQRFSAWCHDVIPAENKSVFHILVWDIVDFLTIGEDTYTMSEDDIRQTVPFIHPSPEELAPTPIIIVVVESFENWVIQEDVMPNLYSLVSNDDVAYFPHLKSQIRQGTSSDGQLIINTGILPLQRGAWSFLHAENILPSITSLYEHSVSLDPSEPQLWNKTNYIKSFGIDEDIQTEVDDRLLFREVLDKVKDSCQCIWTVTMSSHAPFSYYSGAYGGSSDMPSIMARYLYTFQQVDAALGELISSLDSLGYFGGGSLIITGDHTIFSNEDRAACRAFCNSEHYDFDSIKEYVPLIIKAPNITGNPVDKAMYYQMDIYPTILSLIGCSGYFWSGFGVNLLNPENRQNRMIDEQSAFILSDKILRSDYFRILQR